MLLSPIFPRFGENVFHSRLLSAPGNIEAFALGILLNCLQQRRRQNLFGIPVAHVHLS